MLSRLSTVSLALLALPLLAATSVVPKQSTNTTVSWGKCNTGSAQCYKSRFELIDIVHQPKSSAAQNVLGLLGIPIGDITAGVSLTCGPITVIGLGTTQCANQPVCCGNNDYNGFVSLGCTPINVGA
ncbi:fungal hydrophobin [Guyanagaster necrorhizus]|uniref:Hydrophobin n=1 Tax=Guyanagaster necrorhizus TaxID=856835 RepID=A0A9P8AMK3_9AGAR|nr:fungal hydrophobin [Guyanagaster necrorhizus MCA 3950]KAG7440781.1 fungal hydrophobin [Guyanagaster necrorhizus MCA 3950]